MDGASCPCGHELELRTVMNLSLHCEVEVLTCLCGKIRRSFDTDWQRADFIQLTHKLMGVEVARSCTLNEKSQDKFKTLADSL